MKLDRRRFLTGAGLVVTAPAIIRVSSLMAMPRCLWPPVLINNGRLICNGALLRIADYPELFSVVGTSFGATAHHFRLPDLSAGRYLINPITGPGEPSGMLVMAP
jgi:tail collar domain